MPQMLRGLPNLNLYWNLKVIKLWLKAYDMGLIATDLKAIIIGKIGLFKIDLLVCFSEFLIELISWSNFTLFSKSNNQTNSS